MGLVIMLNYGIKLKEIETIVLVIIIMIIIIIIIMMMIIIS